MFRNVKLSHKLIGSFAVMALLVALSGSFGIRSINKVSVQVASMMQKRASQARLVLLLDTEQKTCLADILQACLVRAEVSQFSRHVESYHENREHFRRYSKALLQGDEQLGILPAQKGSVMEEHAKAVMESWAAFEAVAEKVIERKGELLKGANNSLTDERLHAMTRTDLADASDYVKRDVEDLGETVDALMKQAGNEARSIQKSAGITFVLVIFSSVGLAFVFGVVATRYISRRVKIMARALEEGAKGNLAQRMEILSNDELGQVGSDFNVMMGKLSGMVEKVNRSVVELGQISASIHEASRRVVSAAEVQYDGVSQTSSAVIQINASIRTVSQGVDGLSVSASETSSSMLEMAANIEEVALNIDSLAQLVEEVSSSIVEMAASIKQIEKSASILMEATVSTASSVAEMDSTIKQVEMNAMDTASISDAVRRDAETGKSAVEATIEGIKQIRNSSMITSEVIETLSERAGSIDAILSVIDEVAEQTNLLALNAAIIAAQAGEHGKGFAVVADEIKELAERTSISTREISQLIKGVQDETARAVEAIAAADGLIADGEQLSLRSGEALQKIVMGVGNATNQVNSIARACTEQSKGSRMIREAMERVSDMIGQIANATHEQSRASDMIMVASERMKSLTSQVRYSATEQSKVGNVVASSTENVTGMIAQIKRACQEQGRGSEQIVKAVENIQVSTKVNQETSSVMVDVISTLSRQVEMLKKELDNFKIR